MASKISALTDGGVSRYTDQLPVNRGGANRRVIAPAYANDAYIVVQTTANAVTNGANLLAAYAAAGLLEPNGVGLSNNNHAAVVIPPGTYDLGTTPLILLDAFDNVDIIGLTGNPKHVLITSQVVASNSGTVVQQGVQVVIKGVTIDNSAATRVLNDETDASAFCMDNGDGGVDSVYEDVVFKNGSENSWSLRQNRDYAGKFIRCSFLSDAFGGAVNGFSGTMLYPDWSGLTTAWTPGAFTGRVVGARFAPTAVDANAVTLPEDSEDGLFHYCIFVPNGNGLDIDGDAESVMLYCQFDPTNCAAGFSPVIPDAPFDNIRATGNIIADSVIRGASGIAAGDDSNTDADTIFGIFHGEASLNFGSIAAGASEDLTIAVVGPVTGQNTVALGRPAAAPAGLILEAFVSAADVVTVRATNVTASPIDAAAMVITVTVFQYQSE